MLLNCYDLETTLDSLESILGKNIEGFLIANEYRITRNNISWRYDNLNIEDIKNHFQVDNFPVNEVVVNHVASIIDKQSLLKSGLLNLYSLALEQPNGFTQFLKEFDITLRIDSGDHTNPYFEYKGAKVSTSYIEYRFKSDRCINGYLLGVSCTKDSNVKHIRRCPEIISHFGREILGSQKLEESWVNRALPSTISFKVNINSIDKSTFNEELNFQEKQEWLILKAFEYLLFDRSGYSLAHPMIYLKEELNVPARNIIKIKPLREGM